MAKQITAYAFVILEKNAKPDITVDDEKRVKDWAKGHDIDVVLIKPGEWEQPEIISVASDVQEKLLEIATGVKDYMLANPLHPDFEEIAGDIYLKMLEIGGLIYDTNNGKAYLVFLTSQ